MISYIYKVYAYIFARIFFVKFHKFLYQISLRGLGVLNYQNSYLTGEKEWLRQYLSDKKNPVILDVGANVGKYTMDVLEVNNTSNVFAFEPHPITYKKLLNNTKGSKLKTYNVGVGKEGGSLELFDYDNKDGSSHASLFKEVITDIHKSEVVSHSVDLIKLDDFFGGEDIERIDLLKIDTEGNEYNVLLGAKKYIDGRRIEAIHFEFNEMNIISKVSFKDFWDLLSDKYSLYRILVGGELLEIKNYSPIYCEVYAYQNIVALLNDDIMLFSNHKTVN